MDPFLISFVEEQRRWHLAAEVAAHLTEITRWEWSKHAEETAILARRLADEIYEDREPDELIDIVEQLSAAIGNGPAEWLAMLTTEDPDGESIPPEFPRWRADARRAFYTLRADLYHDGRWRAE